MSVLHKNMYCDTFSPNKKYLLLSIMILLFVFIVLYLIAIYAVISGVLVGVLTVPLLYFTGYGFLPLQKVPRREGKFIQDAIQHVTIGAFVFGVLTGILGLMAFLPVSVGVKNMVALAICLGGPLAGVGGVAMKSEMDETDELTPRRVAGLLCVWYGYPLILVPPVIAVGIKQGWLSIAW